MTEKKYKSSRSAVTLVVIVLVIVGGFFLFGAKITGYTGHQIASGEGNRYYNTISDETGYGNGTNGGGDPGGEEGGSSYTYGGDGGNGGGDGGNGGGGGSGGGGGNGGDGGNGECIPITCSAIECGDWDDECGNIINCGECEEEKIKKMMKKYPGSDCSSDSCQLSINLNLGRDTEGIQTSTCIKREGEGETMEMQIIEMKTACELSTEKSRKETKLVVRDVIETVDGVDYLKEQIMTLYHQDQKSAIITRIIDRLTGKTEAVDLIFV